MKYCEKCNWEYEDEPGCLCPFYRRFMESGMTNAVPMPWKLEYWDGYPNDPYYCDHPFFEDDPFGLCARCSSCGKEIPPQPDDQAS